MLDIVNRLKVETVFSSSGSNEQVIKTVINNAMMCVLLLLLKIGQKIRFVPSVEVMVFCFFSFYFPIFNFFSRYLSVIFNGCCTIAVYFVTDHTLLLVCNCKQFK